jgi:hypothetical protein
MNRDADGAVACPGRFIQRLRVILANFLSNDNGKTEQNRSNGKSLMFSFLKRELRGNFFHTPSTGNPPMKGNGGERKEIMKPSREVESAPKY